MASGREKRDERRKREDSEMTRVGRQGGRRKNARSARQLRLSELEKRSGNQQCDKVAGEKDPETCGNAFGMTTHSTGAAVEKRGAAQKRRSWDYSHVLGFAGLKDYGRQLIRSMRSI
jgi:hypothetical protein